MSVELVGTGSAYTMVLPELPALIGPETLDRSPKKEADPSHLCLISQIDGELIVLDLGGKSGTYVNGSRVRRATLKNSDTLGFGGSEYRVRSEPPRRRYLHGVRS